MSNSARSPKPPKRYFACRMEQKLYERLEKAAGLKTKLEGTEFRAAHIALMCINKHLPLIEKALEP